MKITATYCSETFKSIFHTLHCKVLDWLAVLYCVRVTLEESLDGIPLLHLESIVRMLYLLKVISIHGFEINLGEIIADIMFVNVD